MTARDLAPVNGPLQGRAAKVRDPLGWGFPATADPRLATASSPSQSATRRYYFRAFGGGLITKVRLYVAVQSGNLSVSVYANSGSGLAAVPGALIADSGSVACPVVGQADIALGAAVNVTHGDFWFSFAADNVTATFGAMSAQSWLTTPFTAEQDGAYAAPSTATPVMGGLNRWFLLMGV